MTISLRARVAHAWSTDDLRILDAATRREFLAMLGAAGLLAACGNDDSGNQDAGGNALDMIEVTNQFGTVEVPREPQRVIGWEGRRDLETALHRGRRAGPLRRRLLDRAGRTARRRRRNPPDRQRGRRPCRARWQPAVAAPPGGRGRPRRPNRLPHQLRLRLRRHRGARPARRDLPDPRLDGDNTPRDLRHPRQPLTLGQLSIPDTGAAPNKRQMARSSGSSPQPEQVLSPRSALRAFWV